jgi:CRISPR-associated protein (TIGR03984 family)
MEGGNKMNTLESKNGLTPLFLNNAEVKARGELAYDDFELFKKDLIALCGEIPKLAVLYFDFGIEFSLWDGKQFHFHEAKLNKDTFASIQLARIFNKSEEIKVWRSNGTLYYRYRQDSVDPGKEGLDFNAVKTQQVLWGTDLEKDVDKKIEPSITVDGTTFSNWGALVEDRGTRLVVPLAENTVVTKEKRLAVTTWNYIGELDNGLATYVDCRFVGIDIWKDGE